MIVPLRMNVELPTLEGLAERLVDDIRRRRLRPGDRYLTAAEAGRELGVSTASANRAMQILADRNVLLRRRSRGTFIGEAIDGDREETVQTIYVLRDTRMMDISPVSMDRIQRALHQTFRNIGIQISYTPAIHGLKYVRQTVGEAHRNGSLGGVVAISCSREIYQFLGDNRIPTVVIGNLYPDQQFLPLIQVDLHECGRIITQYLIERGHEQFALLPTLSSLAGSHELADGVAEVLTEAELPPNALRVRYSEGDLNVLEVTLRELLLGSKRPTAAIAAGWSLADKTAAVARKLGLRVPEDLEVVVVSGGFRGSESQPFPCVQPIMTIEQVIQQAGRMLEKQMQGNAVEPRRFIIPAERCIPPTAPAT